MSLHSHNGHTNPRNKSQLNSKRKHNSRSEALKQSSPTGMDRPLEIKEWTFRGSRSDHLYLPQEPPEALHPNLPHTDHVFTPCGLSVWALLTV
jgi:hypothetical protein